MDTDLDVVANDPRVSSVDFFRQLPKARVDSPIGETLTPNFYHRISTARLTMLTPSRAIRSRLPEELSPLEVAPGLGLFSLMFFRYDVCDIDFYTRTTARVANDTEDTDVALAAATPAQVAHASGARVSALTSYTTINGAWHSTFSQTNVLTSGTARFPRRVNLELGTGRISDDVRSLKPIKAVQLDVVTDGQLALHTPVPTSIQSR